MRNWTRRTLETRGRLLAVLLACCLALLCFVPRASAQVIDENIVLVIDPAPITDPAIEARWANVDVDNRFDNIADALDRAKDLDDILGETVTIMIAPREDPDIDDTFLPWEIDITILLDGTDDADGPDNIEFVGAGESYLLGSDVIDAPGQVIISHSGTPSDDVFELLNALPTTLIDNLTIQGGVGGHGVEMLGTSQATVSRCHIVGHSAGSGVRCDNDSKPLIVNCVIRDNGDAGVRADDNAQPTVLFCTIFDNTNYGVYANKATDEDPDEADAEVRNCLVYDNGGGTGEGGLIWNAQSYVDTIRAAAAVYNNVYSNSAANYFDLTWDHDPQINPVETDNERVIIVAGPNAGWKLDTTFAGNELIDGADPGFKSVEDYAFLPEAVRETMLLGKDLLNRDIEGEPRPVGGRADIGADEDADGAAPAWDFVEVTPPDEDSYFESANFPTRHAVVGQMDPNKLIIDVGFRSAVGGMGDFQPFVYLVPQGTTGSGGHDSHIPMTAATFLGDGVFRVRNLYRIRTVVYNSIEPGVLTDRLPVPDDVVADGHGAVFCYQDDLTATDIPPGTDQVKTYRHVLIDTVPPRMSDLPASAASLVFLNAADAGDGNNGFEQYAVLNVDPAWHPNYANLPVDWRGWLGVPEYPNPMPYDDGLIEDVPNTGRGAQSFLNPGSKSNNNAAILDPDTFLGESLDAQIIVIFEDPPVAYDDGTLVEGETTDEDQFNTDIDWRQVGGFPPTDSGPYTGHEEGPAQWEFVEGTAVPTGVNVAYTIETGTAENPGYDFRNPGYDFGNPNAEAGGFDPDDADLDNLGMKATWSFEETDIAKTPGIPWIGPGKDYLHMAMKFLAKDLGANKLFPEKPEGSEEPDGEEWDGTYLALDPLHIWWLIDARTQITPNYNDQNVTIDKAQFEWDLRRGVDPRSAGTPQPLFTWRLWASADKTGPYGPLPGKYGDWASWDEQGLLRPEDFKAIDDDIAGGIVGNWLLLVVAGADEAGNVEPWPGLDLNDIPASLSGTNWQRFFLQDPAMAIDTSASVRFWYNHLTQGDTSNLGGASDINLGSNRLVPWRDEHAGVYEIVAEFSGSVKTTVTSGLHFIDWTLVREDGTATVPDVPWNPKNGPLELPLAGADLPTAANKEVGFVFHARAFIDADFNGTLDLDETVDSTPSNIQFSVVWQSVGNHMTPRDSTQAQPIKETARE